MGDIKNPKTQFQFVDTSDSDTRVWIGGGKDDAVRAVGQEFADITGGTNIDDDELQDILAAALTSKGWSDVPGLEGVEIVSLSADSFTIAINGGGPSKDYYSFSGDAAVAAIEAVSGERFDIKNKKSQVAIFDTDAVSKMWIGGGKSDARQNVGEEFADITGGTNIKVDQIDDLLDAALISQGRSDAPGLEGVELLGLTDDGFSLTLDARGPTRDTVIFTGSAAVAAIEAVDEGLVDIKNGHSDFAIFDLDEDTSLFIGGGASNARDLVGEAFADITGGTRIDADEVLDIFDALTSGRSWTDAAAHGLEGVELVGVNDTSFAITLEVSETGPRDTILFTNVDFGDLLA